MSSTGRTRLARCIGNPCHPAHRAIKTVKLRVLSDLHLECFAEPEDSGIRDDVECDAVVLAGDIHNGTVGIEWAARTFRVPVIYIMGNHEYYGYDATELLPRCVNPPHCSRISPGG
ncbi:hypothetical protein S4A8_18743 [Salinisphaera sp. S4-8]